MFRIINTKNQPIWTGGVDPDVEFEPIAQLTIVGGKIIYATEEDKNNMPPDRKLKP